MPLKTSWTGCKTLLSEDVLGKLLLRGCSARPHGKDTLCRRHIAFRDAPRADRLQVGVHRPKRALYSSDDVCHLKAK